MHTPQFGAVDQVSRGTDEGTTSIATPKATIVESDARALIQGEGPLRALSRACWADSARSRYPWEIIPG
jgi:hypothetical protein